MSLLFERTTSFLLHPKTAACAECVYAAHQIADAYERHSAVVILIYSLLLLIAIAHLIVHSQRHD